MFACLRLCSGRVTLKLKPTTGFFHLNRYQPAFTVYYCLTLFKIIHCLRTLLRTPKIKRRTPIKFD